MKYLRMRSRLISVLGLLCLSVAAVSCGRSFDSESPAVSLEPAEAQDVTQVSSGAEVQFLWGQPRDFWETYVSVVESGTLYRSRQPNHRAYEQLKSRGMTSVISLRRSNVPEEAREVAASGLKFKNIPIRDRGIPTIAQVREFLNFVVQRENQPALVHCQGGRGRTGIMSAAYRIAVQNWPVERAIAETEQYGGLSNSNQANFIREFARVFQTQGLGKQLF